MFQKTCFKSIHLPRPVLKTSGRSPPNKTRSRAKSLTYPKGTDNQELNPYRVLWEALDKFLWVLFFTHGIFRYYYIGTKKPSMVFLLVRQGNNKLKDRTK